MAYKSMYKNEIARAAGVSLGTFRSWLRTDTEALRQMGVSPSTKILPPVAVRYLCEKYCIEIDWATQKKRNGRETVPFFCSNFVVGCQERTFLGLYYCQRVSLFQSLGKPIALISASGNSAKSAFNRFGKVVFGLTFNSIYWMMHKT